MLFRPLEPLLRRLPEGWRSTVEWLATIALAVGAVLLVKVEVANPYRIPSPSMEPTLHCARPGLGCMGARSDRVVANRFIYRFREPRRGEIVVFETPARAEKLCGQGGVFVKRLIGLPGDVVSTRRGSVYVNGRKLDEPYVRGSHGDRSTRKWQRVPSGHYFMLGDNRDLSCDSRTWGSVSRDALIGPIVVTYWPPRRIGTP
ncbi:MAG: signal peptidase I [Gaiellaceae bacterium]